MRSWYAYSLLATVVLVLLPFATRSSAAEPADSTELMHIYGATETSPMVTCLPHEELLLDTPLARSCGPACAGVDIDVVTNAIAAIAKTIFIFCCLYSQKFPVR